MTPTTDQIHVLFSEEGEACAIRKWSKEPFYDAQTYVQKALLDTLAARVLELEAENKRLREGLKATQGRVMNVQFGLQTNTTKASAANDLGVIANKIAAALKGGEI